MTKPEESEDLRHAWLLLWHTLTGDASAVLWRTILFFRQPTGIRPCAKIHSALATRQPLGVLRIERCATEKVPLNLTEVILAQGSLYKSLGGFSAARAHASCEGTPTPHADLL
jgi:hypothetical protein